MWRFDISHYSPANDRIEYSRERMDESCPKSVVADKSATAVKDMPSTTTEAAPGSLTVPKKVTTVDRTFTTPETTALRTAGTLDKVPASSERNAGGKLDYGLFRTYLSLAIVLATNILDL